MQEKSLNKAIMEEFELDFSDMASMLNTTLPDPTTLEFYRRLRNREIVLNSIIDDDVLELSLFIRKWNQEDARTANIHNFNQTPALFQRKPIRIFINSDGGKLESVFHVIDAIQLSETPVYTIGMGRCNSAGAMLLIAGHKRFIFPHTTCLIHDGNFSVDGATGKMLDNLEFARALERQVKDYIVGNTKISEDVYDANYRHDWYLLSDEMITYGIADEIVGDLASIS